MEKTLSLKERFLETVKSHYNFRDLKKEFEQWASDKEVVSYTVNKFGIAIQYASASLRNDKEIALKAVTKTGLAFMYISDNLRNDKALALLAIKHDGLLLGYASDNLKDDKELVSLAIQNNPFAFESASDTLRDNKDFVLELVSQNPSNLLFLKYVSDNLQNDHDILQLIKNTPNTFLDSNLYLSEEIETWFHQKMKILEIMEDDAWMRDNIKPSDKRHNHRKF